MVLVTFDIHNINVLQGLADCAEQVWRGSDVMQEGIQQTQVTYGSV